MDPKTEGPLRGAIRDIIREEAPAIIQKLLVGEAPAGGDAGNGRHRGRGKGKRGRPKSS